MSVTFYKVLASLLACACAISTILAHDNPSADYNWIFSKMFSKPIDSRREHTLDSNEDFFGEPENDREARLETNKVLCEVVKKIFKYKVSGMTYKPESLTFYTCRQSSLDASKYSIDAVQDLMMDFDDDEVVEYCWLSKERGRAKCETQNQQVAVFSRELGSTIWSHVNVNVPAGCGCQVGLNFYT